MKPEDFYTRSQHEDPKKFFLVDPLGKETEEYLLVQGEDSKRYQNVAKEVYASIREDSESYDSETSAIDAYTKIISGLPVGWSFKSEFSEEACAELLKNSPINLNRLKLFVQDRANFVEKKSEKSSDSCDLFSGDAA